MHKCGNPECQKEIPENKSYCDASCFNRHLKNAELKRQPWSRLSEEDDILDKIYAYLELDTIWDQRLKLKANLMKKVLFYTCQWGEGLENNWIDRLANRTCVSTRKIREDYILPLVTEGLLERTENGKIRFVGLPLDADKVLKRAEKRTH